MPASETERNKAVSTRFSDAMNTNDPEIISSTIDDLVDVDATIRTPLPLHVSGAQALKEVFLRLHDAYPDLHVAIEDLIAEGDKVVSRNVVTGTHKGVYMALHQPASPSRITRSSFSASSTAELQRPGGVVDVLAQLRQIGAISA